MRKNFFRLGSLMLFALCFPANAQQQTKMPQIGYLTPASRSANAARIDAFRRGLRELGYVKAKKISIEYRYAEGELVASHQIRNTG